ncbi:MAG: hypothetical protein IT380_12915 [Myxococcales bacterium]|nr:hypothetical protein [Myxococcales bacterium]
MLRRLLAVALLALTGCKKEQPAPAAPALAPAEVTLEGAYHAVACGAVTAVFSGNADALKDLTLDGLPPKSFGVEALSFRFADGSQKGFAPSGQLFFSDWRFDVFSPDCQWTALLVDHYGPYHLVKTADLQRYLAGQVRPVVVNARGPEASVLSDGAWRPDGAFEFFASCCGGARVLKATTTGEVSTLFEAPDAPQGLRRVRGGYEVVKPAAR